MSLTYLITGANRGIGLELSRQLSTRGDHVIATARNPSEAKDLNALSVRVEELDVASTDSIAGLVERLDSTPVDVLINNAGIGGHGPQLGELEPDELIAFFRTNTVGPLLVTQALLPNLEAGSRKLIAAITSKMGSIDDNSSGGAYGYRASKTALNMFFRSLAVDLRARELTCIVLHPGWVQTDMGGPRAPVPLDRSVQGLLHVLDHAGPDDTGRFFDFTGGTVPW